MHHSSLSAISPYACPGGMYTLRGQSAVKNGSGQMIPALFPSRFEPFHARRREPTRTAEP